MELHILGIRHHGVGSAKHVRARLDELQPDLILVEGPPEMDVILPFVFDPAFQLPVAALCYDEEAPQFASFYPFSVFSPEWQAIQYGLEHRTPVKMMDLPLSHLWQMQRMNQNPEPQPGQDPIAEFARAAGFEHGESWWELHFEQAYRPGDARQHFEAVFLMMQTLRNQGIKTSLDAENVIREAWMRYIIRSALKNNVANIAVVCGAWHAPALINLDDWEKSDQKLLKSLPKSKIKVKSSWIPWTNSRLSLHSGYGAGIHSPGWYRHLWENPDDSGALWLSKVAQLFRTQKMDVATAHVLEAHRLSMALAALRNKSRPGLQELNESVVTVMCMGDEVLLNLIRNELIVGNVLGSVPENLPKLPLQADFESQIRALRLPLSAEAKEKVLNLREALDLKRSVFLYRLHILNIPWARPVESSGKGTFKEIWELQWSPEMMISLIEKGIWGNTVEIAAARLLNDQALQSRNIAQLANFISLAIPAELYSVLGHLLQYIHAEASVSSDIQELMQTVIPLAGLGRYGNVRKSDIQAIETLLGGLIIRICIGLPNAAFGIDGGGANNLLNIIKDTHRALYVLDHTDWWAQWLDALSRVSTRTGVAPLVSGGVNRLLLDARVLNRDAISVRMHLALSRANEPAESAAWLEGFLDGSSLLLLYDDNLWNLMHVWLSELPENDFVALLPILRRTFSKFEPAARNQLGQKAKTGVTMTGESPPDRTHNFDTNFADNTLPFTLQLLGFNHE